MSESSHSDNVDIGQALENLKLHCRLVLGCEKKKQRTAEPFQSPQSLRHTWCIFMNYEVYALILEQETAKPKTEMPQILYATIFGLNYTGI